MTTKDNQSATATASIVFPFPVGTVIPYAGTQASIAGLTSLGWLLCNGRSLQISSYQALYNAIGTAYGGDGSSVFNLPDLRGQFLRGVDMGAGVDPDTGSRTAQAPGGSSGDSVGSRQPAGLQNHQHYWDYNFNYITQSGNDINVQLVSQTGNSGGWMGRQPTTNNDGGGNETRPCNVYVYYLIFAGLTQ